MHIVRAWVAAVLTKFSINTSSLAPEDLQHVYNLQITTHVYDLGWLVYWFIKSYEQSLD